MNSGLGQFHTMVGTSLSPEAVSYVTALMEAFHDEPAKFEEIIMLLEDIRYHKVDKATGFARVGELLKDHRNLLIGLNAFLPAEAKITIPPEPTRTDANKGLGQLLGRRVSSELTIDDSLAYIAAVKEAFKDEPEKHQEFFQILKFLYTHRENEALCYARVKELMKDHPNLLIGFNAFLPPDAKITIPPVANKGPELTSEDHSRSYIAAVKEAFHDEPAKYQEFLKFMRDFITSRADLTTTVARVEELMKDHPNLLLGFNVFLPAEAKITIPPVAFKEPELMSDDDLRPYIAVLMEAFHDEPEKFEELRKIMSDYRTQRADFTSSIARVKELMKDQWNLFLDFTEAKITIPAAANSGPKLTSDAAFSYITAVKEAFHDEPARYKEFIKLLSDSSAHNTLSSIEQKYPRAHNLVAKVKERFQGDDSHVYKSFLEIVRMLREGNMSRDEVYHEVTILLQDHQDLVMEFSDFFNQ
ncbi:unnamed protein product [Arabis nemorensis]|uniref:Histone deacetylase interacting domain-containing protein n=1 Tax=Arabis nemorensis TaxID=586526 RepID=A0A565B0T9_9BRAS|nr:unnamed protein product [Arabis nemorensis]